MKGNERERFLALLRKYNNCFTRNYGEPGLTDKCEFSIDTGNHAPINEKMRPTNPAQRKALKAELEELSRHKIIKPSFGPWSSHVVMVSKPGGGIRMVLDFRKINKITKYEAYPLPLLTDVLSSLEGNRYFSTLDATKSFWSVPIKEEDQEKTQFATPFGSYCFTRMAMGLKNASQHYCRVMDLLLGSLKYEVAMSFVDDLIVYSKTFDEHLNNLQKVFARVEEFGIRLNAKKCKFLSEEVKFLGHIPHTGSKLAPKKSRP